MQQYLTALACSKAPNGRARWSLRLLADNIVALQYTDKISHETVRRLLKKNELKPWQKQEWVIAPHGNAECVADMGKVLDCYRRLYDPHFPVVCFDDMPRRLIGEFRQGKPM